MILPDDPQVVAFLLQLFADIVDEFGVLPVQQDPRAWKATGPRSTQIALTWIVDHGPYLIRVHTSHPHRAVFFEATVGTMTYGPLVIFVHDDERVVVKEQQRPDLERQRLFGFLRGEQPLSPSLHARTRRT